MAWVEGGSSTLFEPVFADSARVIRLAIWTSALRPTRWVPVIVNSFMCCIVAFVFLPLLCQPGGHFYFALTEPEFYLILDKPRDILVGE